jgi:hypothetical protein
VEYYTSTVSLAQDQIQTYTVRMVFLRDRPQWVRVYECGESGEIDLLKDLQPSLETKRFTEYLDLANEVPARAARIYMFRRSAESIGREQPASKAA